jgi:predicted Fe-Mo cluster-binding NifX family protein
MNNDRKSNSRMKIAIPHENGRLHGRFGGCREFALVQVDAEKRVTQKTDVLPAPEHKPGAIPRWLREQGVEVVIAGGIGHRALDIFSHHGITVRAGKPGARVEALVASYLRGVLTNPPNGCEHHGHVHDHAPGDQLHHGHQF